MNNSLFFYLHNLANHSAVFDNFIIFLAVYFPLMILAGVSLFLVYRSGIYKKENWNWEILKKLIFSFVAVIGPAFIAYIFATILKQIIHIERSFVQFGEVVLPLFDPNQEYSFPSTHASIFSALAFSVLFLHKKAGYTFLVFAFLIGLARVIGGVHFPIDILGGFILGAVVALFAYLIKKR